MKRIIIGFLILMNFGYLIAQDKNVSVNLIMGQTTTDTYKALILGFSLDIPITKHFFFQTGYNFMPAMSKVPSIQRHAAMINFYGGYKFQLNRKMQVRLKGGFYWHQTQTFRDFISDYWRTDDVTGINFSAGLSVKHTTSSNVGFIWGFEYRDYSLVVFTGISIGL